MKDRTETVSFRQVASLSESNNNEMSEKKLEERLETEYRRHFVRRLNFH